MSSQQTESPPPPGQERISSVGKVEPDTPVDGQRQVPQQVIDVGVLYGARHDVPPKPPPTLLDHEQRLVAELLVNFRNLVLHATEPIGSNASAAQAAYNAAAMEIETNEMIKSVEELLQLTRTIRELLIIGPVRKPGEGEQEAEETIGEEVQKVVGYVNQIREKSRRDMIDKAEGQDELGQGAYTSNPPQTAQPDAKADAAPTQAASK